MLRLCLSHDELIKEIDLVLNQIKLADNKPYNLGHGLIEMDRLTVMIINNLWPTWKALVFITFLVILSLDKMITITMKYLIDRISRYSRPENTRFKL